jgi:hypothetical protein
MRPLHILSHDLSTGEKQLIDLASIFTMVGTLTDQLPTVAAAFTILWTGIRIWETPTVQGILGRIKPDDPSKK